MIMQRIDYGNEQNHVNQERENAHDYNHDGRVVL
jgi:hypothetical protein